ncbi:MAG: SHOCT domain-containing protein [Elusimicrobiota bacterium]
MSKLDISFQIPLNFSESFAIVKKAISGLGWRVLNQGTNFIVCKETTPKITSFTHAAKIEVYVHSNSLVLSYILLQGSIMGFGGIQRGHLQGQLGNLQNRIEVLAFERKEQLSKSKNVIDEIKELTQLLNEGHISQEEFKKAKGRLLN